MQWVDEDEDRRQSNDGAVPVPENGGFENITS